MANSTEIFVHHRPELFRLAYAMMGRTSPAEDAVQETFLRWQKQDPDHIQSPKSWLSKVLSRICLDEIKSARAQREQYIDSISREAIKSQRASFRIEGINIPKKRAEEIRREVVKEFDVGTISSKS